MRRVLLTCLFLLIPLTVSAQVLNPTRIEFAPSPDHSATIGATDLVTKYELVYVRQSAPSTPVVVTDAGKPTPSGGVISVPVASGLPNNTLMQVSVRTVGPGGTVSSALSDPFAAVGPPASAGKPVPKT